MSTGAETTAISSGETIRPAREEEVDVSTLPTAAVDEHGELVTGAILGTGGMAVVHSATQTALRRDVALKRAIAGDKESIAALVREARILGALEHPNIPPVHLLATDAPGTPVLAMKRIDGAAWSELLTVAHQDPLDRTLEILEAVCRALQFAHERGIIHRDVKPANVMLGSHGEIYLVDWGIALTRGEACSRPTLASTRAGASGSVRSTATVEARSGPPSSRASSSNRSRRRATSTSRTSGSRARRRAVTAPIPLEAPVIRATKVTVGQA